MTASRDRFDSWLERELRRDLDPVTQRPAPRRPRYVSRPARGRRLVTLFSGAGAAVASKSALGFAVTAFAVGITGAAVETAVTGSPVPVGVEQQVASAVQAITEPVPTQPPAALDQAGGIKAVASAGAEGAGSKPSPAGDHRTVPAAVPSSDGEGHPAAASTESHPTPRRSPATEPEPTPKHTPSPPPSHKPSPLPIPRPAHTGERGGHGEVG